MGAFVACLHIQKGLRRFFVLAPNLTIYDKLIQDFTPNTPKYVLKGIAEFAINAPLRITGDNYENQRVVAYVGGRTPQTLVFKDSVHINVSNIPRPKGGSNGGGGVPRSPSPRARAPPPRCIRGEWVAADRGLTVSRRMLASMFREWIQRERLPSCR